MGAYNVDPLSSVVLLDLICVLNPIIEVVEGSSVKSEFWVVAKKPMDLEEKRGNCVPGGYSDDEDDGESCIDFDEVDDDEMLYRINGNKKKQEQPDVFQVFVDDNFELGIGESDAEVKDTTENQKEATKEKGETDYLGDLDYILCNWMRKPGLEFENLSLLLKSSNQNIHKRNITDFFDFNHIVMTPQLESIIGKLNSSQQYSAKMFLSNPVSIMHGPPGKSTLS